MDLIDTHTHLDFPDFDADRQALMAESRALGVRKMVVLGVYQANWQRVSGTGAKRSRPACGVRLAPGVSGGSSP